jgi:hypothetical protein
LTEKFLFFIDMTKFSNVIFGANVSPLDFLTEALPNDAAVAGTA